LAAFHCRSPDSCRTVLIGTALAVTLQRGGLLLAVLVLPLSIPVLIFGVAASQAAITG
jgi:heme exporter protein B